MSSSTGKIKISRAFLNRDDKRRSLDPNFVNNMTVLVPPKRQQDFFNQGRRKMYVFQGSRGRSILRFVRSSREFRNDSDALCVDEGFRTRLGLRDNEEVNFRIANGWDHLNPLLWYRSLSLSQSFNLRWTAIGVALSSFLGAALGMALTSLLTGAK